MGVITFNELRHIKDSLPDGSMEIIARELNLDDETVRNYFGACNYKDGQSVGMHVEQGPDGGLIVLDDDQILKAAKRILDTQN